MRPASPSWARSTEYPFGAEDFHPTLCITAISRVSSVTAFGVGSDSVAVVSSIDNLVPGAISSGDRVLI